MQVLPTTPAGQHVAQAMVDLDRAALALAPIGIPEDPPPPVWGRAVTAMREAITHFEDARAVADAGAGRDLIAAALTDARAAVKLLERPAIRPPLERVFDLATAATRTAREALGALE